MKRLNVFTTLQGEQKIYTADKSQLDFKPWGVSLVSEEAKTIHIPWTNIEKIEEFNV